MKLKILAALAFLFASAIPAKSDEAPAEFKLTGTIGAAMRAGDSALTFGGPKLQVSHGNLSFSAGLYPSFVYLKEQSPEFRPSLGFGPEVNYKKLGLVLPFYYVRNRTVPFLGLSFKF